MTAPDRSESAREMVHLIINSVTKRCRGLDNHLHTKLCDETFQALLAAEERGEEKGWNKAIKQAALIGEQFEIQDEVSSRIRGLKFKSK